MAKKGSFSKVYDKNGDYADVEAVRFDGTRTFQMQGDVTASQTWNGDPSSPLTLNASIGAKKVTQDKIGDKAVGTGQMADGSVGLTQIAASAMTDSVSANNSKLVTSQGVNAAIAAATLNRGKDYGPMSVDEINAISETIPTGSTVYVEHLGAGNAKVINDGYSDGTMASFSVEVGEDLKYYRAPDNSLHGWHSTEANVKIKQPANYAGGIAVDSAQDASSGSAGIEFIQSFKQNTNGDIRDIVKAQVDIVDSTSSTRTNAAATPNSVKSAYDLANGKYSKPSGGIPKSDLASGVQTSLDKADSALQGVKLAGASSALTPDANKVVTVPNAVPTGSGETNGLMTAADKAKLDGIASGANKVEDSNTNGNIKIDGTETNVYTHPSAGPSSTTSVGDTTNQTPAFGGTFKAISQTVNTDGHTTATSEHTVTLPTDGKDLTSTVATVDNYTNPGSTATALKTLFGKIWNFIGRLRTSWQTTPDDTHFPSEKLVKDSLDTKADANNVVAVYDGRVSRYGDANGWGKIASRVYNNAGNSLVACFRLFTTGVEGNESEIAEWFVSLRSGSSGESATKVRNVLNISKTNNIDAKIKIIGVTGNLTVELWVRPIKYTSLYVQLLNNGTDLLPLYKDWTFYNVSGSTGTEPTTDSQNNVYAYPSTKNVVQYNIAPAVENNLVAMDANGLVKDSGIGSGSLSTALTKLNGIEAGAEANVQSDWDEGDASSDAFIKNKPLYNLYYSSASYKVIASVANTTTTSGVSWSLMYTTRFHNASAFGVIQGHGNIRCSYIKTAGTATSTINFYTAPDPNTEGRTLIIAYLPGYTRFQATYFVRKSEIDFSVFGNNPPEGTTYTDSNLVKAETIVQSEGSSGTAPVKVDESGELIPVPMDSTPTASSTSLMTSGDIKTALDMKAGADNSIAIYDAYVGNTTQAWYKLAERSYTASNTTLNIAFLATICNNASTGPLSFFIHAAVQIPSEAGSSITIRNISSSPISNAFDINRIKNTKIRLVVTGTSGNATVALYLYQGGSSMSMSLSEVCASGVSKPAKKGNWTYTSYPGSSSPGETTEPTGTSYQDMAWVFAKELQTAVTDPTASGTALSFISSLTQDKNGVMTATKKSVLVDSTYSAAGTNPVNGTAVAAALATSLTDVAYVANQSGGGGNLNKTINGTTTSVLAFMNDSEAVAIWADAKTAAANAS